MAELDPDRIRVNLAEVREEVGEGVEVLAATKYVPLADLPVLVEAGIELCGENRAQDLEAKATAHPGLTWDFIGRLQSRKVRQVLPHVRYVHSVATLSALRELGKHGGPSTRVLVEVNIAGEEGKEGIAPAELPAFLERCPVEVVGLMTMPPHAADPEDSRRWFAALRELAGRHGLRELSMGTTQDYAVAAQEGATIVRIGTRLYT
ncbi:MAG TPA: YggS family pyridoxal phosphate enzyme [Solirubrobacteraceae bacterium]|jgi:pyridoxal phosphate enzyme (YggS family)